MPENADRFLAHVREDLGFTGAGYSVLPAGISGGYDTEIIRVTLADAGPALTGERVLRVYRSVDDASRAGQEAAIQNALASIGLPVPKVHLVCTESRHLSVPCLVMDYVPGQTLLELTEPDSSRIMGETHAMIHDADVDAVLRLLEPQGFAPVTLDVMLHRLATHGRSLPWAAGAIDWLSRHRPREGRLSICHGDFHKLNIMQEHGRVTGILDWSGFAALEAAFDVANTQISFLILAKHLTAQGDFEPVDLDEVVQNYRDAYARRCEVDETNLDYYLVLRATMILFLAAWRRAKPYRHPLVVEDTCALIQHISGVRIPSGAVRA